MVFSSYVFIFLFLPACLVLYYLAPRRLRNFSLLFSSLVFYAWGAPTFLPILLACCLVDYLLGKAILKSDRNRSRVLVTIGVTLNLLLLGYFKYSTFVVGQINSGLAELGTGLISWPAVALPIGISFFVFHEISYLVDLYRGDAKGARNLGDYLLYILFFPQLIAGPIIRYSDIAEQLVSRVVTRRETAYGIWRFTVGFAKKILIADQLGAVADHVFKNPDLSCGYAWIGVLSYSFQIYYDFSGYSDMALGLARMFGFKIIENFDQPYLSRNFTEFWRRWHISLSQFMREYVYISIGGNRGSRLRTYANLWLVFLLSGFWHGAQWKFIFWGAYHGLFLSLDKLVGEQKWKRLPYPLNFLMTFFLVSMGWVFFRADSFSDALMIFESLFSFRFDLANSPILLADLISNRGISILAFASVVSFIPWGKISLFARESSEDVLILGIRALLALMFFLMSVASLSASGFSPFLYFRF